MASLPTDYVFVVWNAPTAPLANQPWKTNVAAVYLVNNNRNSFISWKPAAAFPAVTSLTPGAIYLFQVSTAFVLTGAELDVLFTAPAPTPTPAPAPATALFTLV